MALVWATQPEADERTGRRHPPAEHTPAAQVWLGGAVIDEVVAGIQTGGAPESVRPS